MRSHRETVASKQRLAILLALTDLDPGYGKTVSQIAGSTPWPPAVLYTPLYQLTQVGLVWIDRKRDPMLVALVEHPDLAVMNTEVMVLDVGEDA